MKEGRRDRGGKKKADLEFGTEGNLNKLKVENIVKWIRIKCIHAEQKTHSEKLT